MARFVRRSIGRSAIIILKYLNKEASLPSVNETVEHLSRLFDQVGLVWVVVKLVVRLQVKNHVQGLIRPICMKFCLLFYLIHYIKLHTFGKFLFSFIQYFWEKWNKTLWLFISRTSQKGCLQEPKILNQINTSDFLKKVVYSILLLSTI